MEKLKIEKLVLGMVQTNVYLAVNQETEEAILIDPAAEAASIARLLEERGYHPAGILLTHGHFDHIGAAEELAARFGLKIGAGSLETGVLGDSVKNLSAMYGRPFTVKADCLYKDGDDFEMAGFSIRVFHTPGHTEGGVCYYLPGEAALFSGDTLFNGSVGRTDFPTGSMSVLVRSVRKITGSLPGDTAVYPGHGPDTTIAYEKECNPFL